MTVAMALAEAAHHAAPRRQTPVSAIREEVENVTHVGLRAQKSPPPGVRPGILPEPGPQRSDRTVRNGSWIGFEWPDAAKESHTELPEVMTPVAWEFLNKLRIESGRNAGC